jgi:hypothetical protein
MLTRPFCQACLLRQFRICFVRLATTAKIKAPQQSCHGRIRARWFTSAACPIELRKCNSWRSTAGFPPCALDGARAQVGAAPAPCGPTSTEPSALGHAVCSGLWTHYPGSKSSPASSARGNADMSQMSYCERLPREAKNVLNVDVPTLDVNYRNPISLDDWGYPVPALDEQEASREPSSRAALVPSHAR